MSTSNATTELCDELDLQVLKDCGWPLGGAPSYAFGVLADRGAGLPGFRVTPWFDSLSALERHCADHHYAIIEMRMPE